MSALSCKSSLPSNYCCNIAIYDIPLLETKPKDSQQDEWCENINWLPKLQTGVLLDSED